MGWMTKSPVLARLVLLLVLVGCQEADHAPLGSPVAEGKPNSGIVPSADAPLAEETPLAPVHVVRRADYDLEDHAAIEQRMKDDIFYLASDELAGRGPYSAGLEAAAQHIAREFKQAGLKTDLIEGQPFQVFHRRASLGLGREQKLNWQVEGRTETLTFNEDFRPLSASSTAKVDLPLVFAGYGITSAEDEYDDYQGLDVAGKGVILLRHEPDQRGLTGKFAGKENSEHAFLRSKIANALKQGAAAIFFCSSEWAVNENDQADDLLNFNLNMPRDFRPSVPVAHLTRDAVDRLLSSGGHPSLADLEREIDTDLQPRSFPLNGAMARADFKIINNERTQKNVLGLLPGKGDLGEETIVLGAHYDHLGRGGGGSLAPWTSEIHNGADDNASGTTVLLELARQIQALEGPHRRRILCIAFAAEEQGLIGSEYYVRHPLFAMENTKAMLNFDMVGRLREGKLTVYGVDTAKQYVGLLRKHAEPHTLNLKMTRGGYGPSDHASFYSRGVPVLHFFTGFHPQYHRPSDTADLVNIEGLRKIAQLASGIIPELATGDITPAEPGGGIAGLGIASDLPPGESASREKPPLGVQVRKPGMGQGIEVRRVISGTPAEAAGLRAGDRILTWNETPVETVPGLIGMAKGAEPMQKVPLKILRGTIELEVTVAF
ncbi:MAG: M20/M25/M40 family metallo-hydrolase [Pirellulaceae bacterium]